MPFSEHYLGSPIAAMTFEAIEQFILKQEPESQTLEYKSDGTKLSEHGDVIAAFLNSGGGLLIVGAPEEIARELPGGRKVRVCQGKFNPFAAMGKDDAHRSLLSKVSPIPATVRVQPIAHDGGNILIVDVEASSYPPHQHDGTYWLRLDGETRKAPHALVESLFLQRRGPNLEVSAEILECTPTARPGSDAWRDLWQIRMRLFVRNNSRNIAEFAAMDLRTDHTLSPIGDGLSPADPLHSDMMLPALQDDFRGHLLRYRQRQDVFHAYEWKAFEGEFLFSVSLDPPHKRDFRIIVELQAKDMLRRRTTFAGNIGFGPTGARIEAIQNEALDRMP